MATNRKKTSTKVSSLAGSTLGDKSASKIQKSLAGSALAQSRTKKQTGADMEDKASRALKNDKSSNTTRSLAGSIVSQSNKKR